MVSQNTDVSLCSLALSKCGEQPIQSLEDQDDIAGVCSRIWPSLCDYLLSLYPWPFAKKKRTLVIAADVVPENEYVRAFKLPDDMLDGPNAVYANGSKTPAFGWEVFGDYLYCDYDTVSIDYKGRPAVSEYPGYYYEFAATALASKLAKPVTENSTLAADLHGEAFGSPQFDGQGGMFATCRRIAAQNKQTSSIFQNGNPLSRARRGG